MGGWPASAPAMSNPATPRSRQATLSSAISREQARVRVAVSSWRTTIRPPAAAWPSSKPSLHRGHHLVEREVGGEVLLPRVGAPQHNNPKNPRPRQVLDALAGERG